MTTPTKPENVTAECPPGYETPADLLLLAARGNLVGFGEAVGRSCAVRDEALMRLEKIAALTDEWLCRSTQDRTSLPEAAALCRIVAQVRELLPEDTRYNNG